MIPQVNPLQVCTDYYLDLKCTTLLYILSTFKILKHLSQIFLLQKTFRFFQPSVFVFLLWDFVMFLTLWLSVKWISPPTSHSDLYDYQFRVYCLISTLLKALQKIRLTDLYSPPRTQFIVLHIRRVPNKYF